MSNTENRVREACKTVLGTLESDRRACRLCAKTYKTANPELAVDKHTEAVNHTIAIRVLKGHIITPNTLEAIESLEKEKCGITPN